MAEDRCPRCGGVFRCGMKDPGPCPCTAVALTPEDRAELARRYQGCLCVNCLAAVARGELDEKSPAAPGFADSRGGGQSAA
jgi:hypothetical protein